MTTIIRRLAPVACLALVAAATTPATASESYDNCTGTITSVPTTISTQGVWCLKGDVATGIASGAAITIAANNVTLDCNDFKIGGLSAGPATEANGVVAATRLNVVIRHCNIRGFRTGIDMTNGGGHLVEDNRLDGNTIRGINVTSAGSTVRRNFITDTGGATVSATGSYGITISNGVDALDNTIDGVMPNVTDTVSVGIAVSFNADGTVSGNRIKGVVSTAGSTAYGIFVGFGYAFIEENFVYGSAATMETGLYCNSNQTTSVRNNFAGMNVPTQGCFNSGDVVNVN